jgi:hypothetical protein
MHDIISFQQMPDFSIDKRGIVVRDNSSWDPKMAHYVFFNEVGNGVTSGAL